MEEYIPLSPEHKNAQEYNQNLPRLGGIYNSRNLQVYHYGGNNPLKYTDPTGMYDSWEIDDAALARFRERGETPQFFKDVKPISVSELRSGIAQMRSDAQYISGLMGNASLVSAVGSAIPSPASPLLATFSGITAGLSTAAFAIDQVLALVEIMIGKEAMPEFVSELTAAIDDHISDLNKNLEDLNDNNSQWQEILNDDTASDKSKQIARDQIQKNNARIDEINDKINNLQEAKTKLEE